MTTYDRHGRLMSWSGDMYPSREEQVRTELYAFERNLRARVVGMRGLGAATLPPTWGRGARPFREAQVGDCATQNAWYAANPTLISARPDGPGETRMCVTDVQPGSVRVEITTFNAAGENTGGGVSTIVYDNVASAPSGIVAMFQGGFWDSQPFYGAPIVGNLNGRGVVFFGLLGAAAIGGGVYYWRRKR